MPDGILAPCNVAQSRHWFRQVTAPCSVACGSGIVTVNSPSGSTLQCDTWLWDDMPLNSPKRPPYWNSTSGFHFHTSPQSTCLSVPVCKILSKWTTLGRKKWRHVDFQDGGSQPSWIVGIRLTNDRFWTFDKRSLVKRSKPNVRCRTIAFERSIRDRSGHHSSASSTTVAQFDPF